MLQSNLATASQFQQDHVVIGGRVLEFESILNEAFFVPSKIAELSETFKNNEPFPHLVFEGLFSPVLLELMYEDFNHLKKDELRVYNNMNEKKMGTLPFTRLGHASELYFQTVHSAPFINFLEQITGIEGLIIDPGLSNGGLHAIPTGGKFAMHVDFNQHEITKLDNRLVFITYLNKDWLPAYGGALELWSQEEEKCAVEVHPVFGRSALFAHSSRSLHGHPTPVDAPNGRPRRSAATYYYSNGRSDGESTSFHTTIILKRRRASERERIATSIKYMTPPIVVDGIQKLKAYWRK
jgi:Rps23 Pro-64 3,4-dihydroxylase Tpa1-like proline 4-hydroxylase